MTEQLRMDLRPHRRPKYRPTEEQDPDNPAYTRPNYLKMTNTPITQEYTSPAIILNQNAKLLVKLVNQVNKRYNDMRLKKGCIEKAGNKREMVLKDRPSKEIKDSMKKQLATVKLSKLESQKKPKELYNFKEIHQNPDLIKTLSQQQLGKGLQNLQTFSSLINNKGIYSGPLSSQLSQLQSLYPNLDLQGQNLNQASSSIQLEDQRKHKSKPKTQNLTKNAAKLSNKNKQQLKPDVDQAKEQKIFKRSAYHVAIAYHIYLKQLYDQGITSGNLIDPTYKARVVKENNGFFSEDA